jgi:hypothetical protein
MNYFKPNTKLTEKEKSYCRCIAHVAGKQSLSCLRSKGWSNNGKRTRKCVNPYPICTKSVGRTGAVECFVNYNLANIPKNELLGLAAIRSKKKRTIKRKTKNKKIK